MKKEPFGITKDGKKVSKFSMINKNGMELELCDFGPHILAIRVPDKFGIKKDVILGYDTLEEYYDNDCSFGAYVGRNANRIAGACVTLDGVEYPLEVNDHGCNNVHSGSKRSHYEFYDAVTGKSEEGVFVEFSRVSPHLEQDFPGDLKQKLRYTFTEENELVIDYEMVSNMTTVINPTNHSFFNVGGHDCGDILKLEMEVYSEGFLVTDENLIPTGEVVSVEGTPMDFRKAKPIGKDIEADYRPLQLPGGYDHNFVFEDDGEVKLVAKITSPDTGITMKVFTDLCGMQIYSGNFLGKTKGKNGAVYDYRGGICFETQLYPNACKTPGFKSSIFKAGEVYRSRTIYQFETAEK